MTVVFLDCETTGLDPDRHEIWELAIITGGVEYEWQLPVDLVRADPTGLRVGRFYERRRWLRPQPDLVAKVCRYRTNPDDKWIMGLTVRDLAETVASLLDGQHIVGAVPSFDAAFLTRWLNANGQAATWHYHLIDVEALAVGYLANAGVVTAAPWNSGELSVAMGVTPDPEARHTALGDARWAKALYGAVMGS